MNPIILADYQKPHYDRLLNIMRKHYGAIDTSAMGAGKTVTTTYLAQKNGFRSMLVFGPTQLKEPWEAEARRQGIHLEFFNYTRLSNANFPYTTKDYEGNIVATHTFRTLLNSNVLIVFDEVANLKNASSSRTANAHAMIRALLESKSGSRVIALSATPIDKEEQTGELMKSVGIVKQTELYYYDKSTREYYATGINDMIDFANTINAALTQQIVEQYLYPLNKASVQKTAFELYLHIIKGEIASSMIRPTLEKDAYNGYFKMDENDYKTLKDGVNQLKDAVGFRNGQVEKGKHNMGGVVAAQTIIEKAKMPTIIRAARQVLEDDINSKVLIFVQYKDSVNQVLEKMAEYHPIAIVGDVLAENRQALLDVFQQPNHHRRVIVANLKIASSGLNLGDTDGRFPRYIFMVPNYHFIDLQQASGRATRLNSKSVATIFLVYGKNPNLNIDASDPNQMAELYDDLLEQSIFDAIARKTDTTKNSVIKSDDTLYPGEYPLFVEP